MMVTKGNAGSNNGYPVLRTALWVTFICFLWASLQNPYLRRGGAKQKSVENSVGLKEECEMSYWKQRKQGEGTLGNTHYEAIYTNRVNLTAEAYKGKKVLDIGCGPRGSLEWLAGEATAAVCIDPLSIDYGPLGASDHQMLYVKAGSEELPFPSVSFDVVTSINNLDHVEDVPKSLREIRRVLRPGGMFLLLVDLHPEPNACEPRPLSYKSLIADIESTAVGGMDIKWSYVSEIGNQHCKLTGTEVLWKCPAFDFNNHETRRSFLAVRAYRRA